MSLIQCIAGQRFLTQHLKFDLEAPLLNILAIPPNRFDRYDNPFEQKFTLRDKFADAEVTKLFVALEEMVGEASTHFDVPLEVDSVRHYAGIFKYMPGDHLGIHVDAGIHPLNGKRKHVTAILYLGSGGGPLEFWEGSSCVSSQPNISRCVASIVPAHGQLVMFENNDYSWHGARINESNEVRTVVTVSYLSNELASFENKNRRAFFVPRPEEPWDAATYALRDKRADASAFSQVYRVPPKKAD